jgi:hypothetical protein
MATFEPRCFPLRLARHAHRPVSSSGLPRRRSHLRRIVDDDLFHPLYTPLATGSPDHRHIETSGTTPRQQGGRTVNRAAGVPAQRFGHHI